MSLINCPECNNEISDKAITCPNCGFPLTNTSHDYLTQNQNEIVCPGLPHDLSIGKQIVNWSGNAALSCEFRSEDNIIREITPGKVHVLLHKKGISINSILFQPYMQIDYSQIISTKFADTTELLRQEKSILGRAVVGSLIMGPLGAIIGGMSGIGTKSVEKNSYMVLNYWDKQTNKAQTILMRGNDSQIRAFVGRLNDELNKKSIP